MLTEMSRLREAYSSFLLARLHAPLAWAHGPVGKMP